MKDLVEHFARALDSYRAGQIDAFKRVIIALLGGCVLVAVGNKIAEAAGAMTCDCADHCWCQRAA